MVRPVKHLWQAILHVSSDSSKTEPPNLEKIRVGKELLTNLIMQIYQMASANGSLPANQSPNEEFEASVLNTLPVPLFIMDKQENIVYANDPAGNYIGQKVKDVIGKNIYAVLDLSFGEENTLDAWLATARTNKVTDTHMWERVRLKHADQKTIKQFDLAAYYAKDRRDKVETMLVLFDHTESYGRDDQSLSFVALAVHELRTPLTMLRGYIEVFEDEFAGKLDNELTDFMHKMKVSAQQLTIFVNNILNVAKIDADQLTLQLTEEKWEDVLKGVIDDLQLRAQVYGKTITCDIAPDLPTVAVDRVSIYEVLGNLIDNAIKYSPKSDKIMVKSALKTDGSVETTVRDFGVGIPASVLPTLFEKFQRNHRNRAQIGGTGLGLYLSKSIIGAHGGDIWVNSKEGEGSTFGFTLVPYAQLADEQKNSNNKEIVRGAHGWIKNHSLYRR